MREKCSEVANDDPFSEWGGGLGTYGGPEGTHKCTVIIDQLEINSHQIILFRCNVVVRF